ncbi:MAG TPA: 4Fe-4S dicluster domain-containing protein, partial [Desulfosarcina sp.]|nr:4Fe-4S dicluster domain-containing protein [Desulfosarcina sp.]
VFHGPVPSRAEETVQETGAIILATGFRPYAPKTGEYGHGDLPEVITLSEMIKTLSETPAGASRLLVNGRPIRRVGFVHCVGSRQIPGIHEEDESGRLNEYCSRVCCTSTLRAACEIRERFPETGVFDFYRDIRTYGRGHEGIYDKASADGVVFFRFEAEDAPKVEKAIGGDHPLQVTVKDVLTFGEEVTVGLDLLVLATGMEAADITGLVEMMKLPLGQERFLQEVHPKLRPVELANGGMMLAGTCQAPMDIGEACAAAQAAAVKASALLARGYVELDPFVAEIDPEKCKGHGECAKECPEKAIQMSEGGKAAVVPALCTGCGMCVAVCPENAIDVAGWTLKQYEAMVDAIAGLEGGVS